MFALVPIHDTLTAKAKTILPNTPVHEDMPLDEVSPQTDQRGQMIPYVVLRYGPIRKAYGTGEAIAGVRHDNYFGTFDLMTVAPTGRMARQMFDILTDAYIGFDAGGGGTVSLEGAASNFVVSSNEVRPTQFVCMVRLKFPMNGVNVGVPLTP